MGLPTVAIAMLASVMSPAKAAAILIAPSLFTNVWQMLAGPYLARAMRRLGPMLIGLCVGAWAGARNSDRRQFETGRVRSWPRADRLCGARLEQNRILDSAPRRNLGRAAGRTGDRRGHGGDRNFRHPGLALHAGDRAGEGRTGAGARPAFHDLDASRSPAVLWSGNAFDTQLAMLSLIAIVPALIGMVIGQRVRQLVSVATFRCLPVSAAAHSWRCNSWREICFDRQDRRARNIVRQSSAARFHDVTERDTIYALSSGRPPVAVAVVRISGPRAGDALKALTGKIPRAAAREPSRASAIRRSSEIIDEALALFFPAPNSETGEDVAELQLHGGRAVIAALVRGARAHGRIAAGRARRVHPPRVRERQARPHRGRRSRRSDLCRHRGAAPPGAAPAAGSARRSRRRLAHAADRGAGAGRSRHRFFRRGRCREQRHRAGARRCARAAERNRRRRSPMPRAASGCAKGLVVAIAGPPNAGKSTLLNRIARREASIVSPFAGTTRDVIEVHLDLDGYPVTLLDTAGIRETDDPVEREGVARAQARAAAADLVLWVVDAADAGRRASAGRWPRNVIVVRNKIDLVAPPRPQGAGIFDVSSTTGAGHRRPARGAGGIRRRSSRLARAGSGDARASAAAAAGGRPTRSAARSQRRRRARTSSPRSCGSRPARSAASPAGSMSRIFST